MNGSEVTVAVLGRKEVGKTTFIAHCLELFRSEVEHETTSTVAICGRDVRIKMIRNPQKQVLARVAVVLMDLTDEDGLEQLPASLELSQRLTPNAAMAIVATKADLYRNRKIATEDAVKFCKGWPQAQLPYYETGLDPPDSILFAFQEILAKPLIDEYLQEVTTEPELASFVNEAMDWCLDNRSANLLTHLLSLGHPIPPHLFPQHPDVISEYLFTEYPPLLVPEFVKNDLSTTPETLSFEDTLDIPDEPLQIVDTRPAISVTDSCLLPWRNIPLTVFLSSFLQSNSLSLSSLTHIDLSHNLLSDVPLEMFCLPALKSLDVSHNRMTALPPIEQWGRGSRLQCLNASHNLLTGGGSPQLQRRGDVDGSVPYVGEVWNVDLSHNKFCDFPSWVLRFPHLRILNLAGNPQIRRLPAQLSQMPHLTSLSVDSHSLYDPPPVVTERGSVELLRYLQLKREASQPWNSLPVVVVGPKGAGKSLLVAKIKEDKGVPSGPTKGLEVSEWRHRSSEFFSFKPKLVTVDFWDYSGDPKYHIVYSCFKRTLSSLHLMVCDAQSFQRQTLLSWLAGIQATSVERVPVVIIFTHFDKLSSREQKETFRRNAFQWLHSWEQALHSGPSPSSSAFSQSVRNIYGDEVAASLNSQPAKASASLGDQDSPTEDLPLLPVVHRVFFVNSLTGDGIGGLRKCLVKIASGSLSQEISGFSGFQMIGRDIPSAYVQVEMIIRHLRGKFRISRREGEQRPFYTVSELFHKKLRKPLTENGIIERDFVAALSFLHQYGLVYLHKCRDPLTTLVSVDPQLLGFLLQRMIRAGIVTQEVTSTSCYLPNSHIFMLWGVEPVWSLELEQASDLVHSQHLLDYLYSLNLCTPLLPGLTLLPSLFPSHLPSPHYPSPSPSLRSRRVYFFAYFPVHLFTQIASRVIARFLKEFGGPLSPVSPGQAPPSTMSVPFEMHSGQLLYVWKNNLFMRHVDNGQLLIKLLVGSDVCPGAVPHEARLDILLDALPGVEAKWLRIVTTEIDRLLEHSYPGLFSPDLPRQLVQICVPFTLNAEGEREMPPLEGGGEMGEVGECGEGEGGKGEEERDKGEEDVELDGVAGGRERRREREGEVVSEGCVFVEQTSPQRLSVCDYRLPRSSSDGGACIGSECVGRGAVKEGGGGEGRTGGTSGGISVVGSLPVPVKSIASSSQQRLMVDPTTPSSWEILSKRSSTSTRFSIKTLSDALCNCNGVMMTSPRDNTFLVPVWQCLQSAFKSPVIHVRNRKLYLNELVPDLLFGDIPSELILQRIDESTSEASRQTGLETGRMQNGMKPSSKWNGFGTDDRQPIRHQSLPEQNGMETGRLNHQACTVDSVQQRNGIGTHGSGPQSSTSSSGLSIRLYYSRDDEEKTKDAGGVAKMLHLKKCLQKAREDLNKLRRLQCPYLVSAVGIHFSPPSVGFEGSPVGSLRQYLREEGCWVLVDIGSDSVHHILLQLLNAVEYFHREGLNYHTLQSENVLLWSTDPISIKLSESGITHTSQDCELCSYLKAIPSKNKRKLLATRMDYILLGLLIYEISTGRKAYEHVYPLSAVALALLHRKLTINVEAELNCERKQQERAGKRETVSCHRMCMQTTIDECISRERIIPNLLKTRLSLCGGKHEWSPMRLTLNPECILSSEGGELIYWASGSRGLVTGTLDASTGVLNSNILQDVPFVHKYPAKPVPIAVGRATALTLVEETQQLWVGAENGSRGSVYVFKLPDMRQHHYIHLQDAVLSLGALNKMAVRYGGEQMKYRVVVGLANGTIIQFLGAHQGKICENPLQGPKLVIHLLGNRPCIAIQLTTQGHVWCSSGNGVEVLDAVSLKSIRRLSLVCQEEGQERPLQKNDAVTLLCVNSYGLWTVGRRSSVVRLWNQESGKLIASYNVHDVLGQTEDDITAMALQGSGVWLGTRNGFLFFLDGAAIQERRVSCLLGLQHCGEGRIKNIVPLANTERISSKLEVFCSQEFPDEVSGSLMMWQFQAQQDWRPRSTRSHSAPLSHAVTATAVSS